MILDKRLEIRLHKDTKAAVMKLAAKKKVKVSDMVREWIETRLDENKFSKL